MQFENKLLDHKQLNQWLARWRLLNKRIVFTNGCFDLIHYGHLRYLAEARSQGDILIVGLNSDDSVSRLKGASRPIKDQRTRAALLCALQFVDAVILFEQDTPAAIIEKVQPDVLVKGGDYKAATIVGADTVKKAGGEVLILPFEPGYSSTNYIEKIKH